MDEILSQINNYAEMNGGTLGQLGSYIALELVNLLLVNVSLTIYIYIYNQSRFKNMTYMTDQMYNYYMFLSFLLL